MAPTVGMGRSAVGLRDDQHVGHWARTTTEPGFPSHVTAPRLPASDPFIHLVNFELPQPAELVRGHALPSDPLVDRRRLHAEVGGDLGNGQPPVPIVSAHRVISHAWGRYLPKQAGKAFPGALECHCPIEGKPGLNIVVWDGSLSSFFPGITGRKPPPSRNLRHLALLTEKMRQTHW